MSALVIFCPLIFIPQFQVQWSSLKLVRRMGITCVWQDSLNHEFCWFFMKEDSQNTFVSRHVVSTSWVYDLICNEGLSLILHIDHNERTNYQIVNITWWGQPSNFSRTEIESLFYMTSKATLKTFKSFFLISKQFYICIIVSACRGSVGLMRAPLVTVMTTEMGPMLKYHGNNLILHQHTRGLKIYKLQLEIFERYLHPIF